MSATWEIQKAIYDALSNNSAFMTLISSRLYDEPQTDNQYPFIVIGDCTEISDNRLDKLGYENTCSITIETKPEGLGFYPAKMILYAMNGIINVKKLTLTNYNMLMCKIDNVATAREGDKRIILARYRIWAHSNSVHTI